MLRSVNKLPGIGVSVNTPRNMNPHPSAIDLSRNMERSGAKPLPLAWREFIRFCADLQHGEIERLSIQDGVPVLAEITKKKVRFTGGP